VRWLGGKKIISIFGVQGSNFTNDIVPINNGKLIEYSIIRLPSLGAYLGRLGGLRYHLNYFLSYLK
jgi:hypothetical protein